MIYEVRARLYFEIFDEANDFYHDCEVAFAKSTLINPDSENAEFATIDWIENHHDEDPNGECYLLEALTNQPPPEE